ncbi:MAG: hypothetical protein MMC23_005926 [Stictis urceolatum]|nr:hypothetical protein [Stictis urceolata]
MRSASQVIDTQLASEAHDLKLILSPTSIAAKRRLVSSGHSVAPVRQQSIAALEAWPVIGHRQLWPRASSAWTVLNSWMRPNDKDASFWWEATGISIASMMEEANYSVHEQYEGLLFHLKYVVPRFGPRPTRPGPPMHWKSFMTDDYSPLEYSWSWDNKGENPKIRFSIEAIGARAGTAADPYNQAMTRDLMSQLDRERPGIDWRWLDSLADSFTPQDGPKTSLKRKRSHADSGDSSSLMMAFELHKGNIATKAYFVPVKADQLGISRLEVLGEGIRHLQGPKISFPAYDVFEKFVSHPQRYSATDVIGVAVDCIAPEQSRLKLYIRSSKTTFKDVRAMLSMDGAIDVISEADINELKELWYLVLGLSDSHQEDHELTSTAHATSGVLYNYDIKSGYLVPDPKIYIPVRHYGQSDEAIAQGLATYLAMKNRDTHVAGYMRMLKQLCAHRSLSEDKGLHTYISVGFKNGQLALTSYFSPEIYHDARWQWH